MNTKTSNKEETLIGVLLVDIKSQAQIGFIKFDPSGMLIYQVMESGLHYFAFRGFVSPAVEKWAGEPLYRKHQALLEDGETLPKHILEQEAKACAEYLNACQSPIKLGSHVVRALNISVKRNATGNAS